MATDNGDGQTTEKKEKFNDITTAKELAKYIRTRNYNRDGYSHYTTVWCANSILKTGSFWLGCVENLNDTIDSSHFSDKKMWYLLSLTQGKSEDLPLWAIYSKGAKCRGARINMTSRMVKSIVDSGKFELEFYAEEKDSIVVPLSTKCDINVEFRDIVYTKQDDENEDRMFIKFKGKTNKNISRSDFKSVQNDFCHFEKGYIWNYEKESRLLVHIASERVQKKVRNFDEQGYKHRLVLYFDKKDMVKNISVTFGPGIKREEISEQLAQYEDIRKLTEEKMASEYAGTVAIDLCNNCEGKNLLLALPEKAKKRLLALPDEGRKQILELLSKELETLSDTNDEQDDVKDDKDDKVLVGANL